MLTKSVIKFFINTSLLLLSAFSFNRGKTQRIMFLQTVLFSTSVFLAPTSPISSFTTSRNLLFDLPLFLFSGNCISIIFLPIYSWFLLMTCPYHLSLPSLVFMPNRSTLTVFVYNIVFSRHFHSKPQHFHLCNFHLFHLFFCDCHRLESMLHCWSYHSTVQFSFYSSWYPAADYSLYFSPSVPSCLHSLLYLHLTTATFLQR